MIPWLYDSQHQTMRIHYRDMVYEGLRWATYPNSWIKRVSRRWLPSPPPYKLHLGSGRYYMPGWVNIDLHPGYKKDLLLDLRNPWPFRNADVSHAYAMHVFEHFDLLDLQVISSECLRVLRPGGVLRVVVPSLEKAIKGYLVDDFSSFHNADKCSKSRGRKFNDAMLYHSQHKLLFDYSFLEEVFADTGFGLVTLCEFRQSAFFPSEELAVLEREEHADDSIFVEAVKRDTQGE